MDLASLENPDFHDKLERACTQSSTRLAVLAGVGRVCQNLVTLVSFSIGVLWFSPMLCVLLGISVLPVLLGEARFAQLNYLMSRRRTPQRRELDYIRLLVANASSAKEAKLFGLEDYFVQRYRGLVDKFYEENRWLSIRRAVTGSLLGVLGSLSYYGAYAYVVYRTLTGPSKHR